MYNNAEKCSIALILCTAIVYCLSAEINADIQNLNVDRKVDLTTHVVKITNDVTFINNGNAAVRAYLFGVPLSSHDKLSFIGAKVKDSSKSSNAALVVTPVKAAGADKAQLYSITLPSPLTNGRTLRITIDTIYPHFLRPFPVEILQSEKQYVVYEGELYFYSPYTTTTQSTVVQTVSTTIESYSKVKPTTIKENTIIYGPYENVAPFTDGTIRVHYENNTPFLTVTDLLRIIEVSHWGNIAIEEHIDITHSGAKLKGPFSRYHYQRQQDGIASVRAFKTILPASARDVYYRDEIGNISTSNMREMDDAVEVELRPRFPLFGGWNTHYYLGYNVPSYEYLFYDGNQYVLKLRFIDHIIDDQVIDKTTVRVILPEGASDISVKSPYTVKREKDEIFHTYLDTIGRPVVILTKENIVENHIVDFEVHYKFSKFMLFQEPLLVVTAFYLFCIVVIIYVRLDFSITKDEAKEARMRIASQVDEIRSAQDRRDALHQTYDDAIKKFKTSKDPGSFKAAVKKIDGDYRALTQTIDTIISQLKSQGSDILDKASDLQRLEAQYKEQIQSAIQSAEKVVAGKIGRQAYDDAETTITTKRSDIYSKIETVLDSL